MIGFAEFAKTLVEINENDPHKDVGSCFLWFSSEGIDPHDMDLLAEAAAKQVIETCLEETDIRNVVAMVASGFRAGFRLGWEMHREYGS